MAIMNVTDARAHLSDAIDAARTEAVFLERHGRPAGVLLSPEHYARLMDASDDAADVIAFDAAMVEGGDNIPWDQVKADLGWA